MKKVGTWILVFGLICLIGPLFGFTARGMENAGVEGSMTVGLIATIVGVIIVGVSNDNKPKTHKIGRKMSSPEAIQYHNNNGSEQNISLNKAMINNIYYENSSGKNKRDEKSKIKRKISDSIKKTIYRLKSEKNK